VKFSKYIYEFLIIRRVDNDYFLKQLETINLQMRKVVFNFRLERDF
jgi:hypothetical protein